MKNTTILLSVFLLAISQQVSFSTAHTEMEENGGRGKVIKLSNDEGTDIVEVLAKQDSTAQKLNFSHNKLSSRGIQNICNALANSNFPNLTELDFLDCNLSRDAAFVLSFSQPLNTVMILKLNGNEIEDAGVKYLTDSRHLTNLETLELASTGIGNSSLGYLAGGPLLKLKFLKLDRNSFSSIGSTAIASFPFKLQGLSLNNTGFDDLSIQTIVQSECVKGLQILSLQRLNLTSGKCFDTSKHLGALQKLDLSFNKMNAAAIGDIVSSKAAYKDSLDTLILSDNFINDSDLNSLNEKFALTKLHRLYLGNSSCRIGFFPCQRAPRITDAGIEKLVGTKGLSTLTHLDISGGNITDDGIEKLVSSDVVKNIVSLFASGNFIGDTGASAISHSLYLDKMKSLMLNGNKIDKIGAKSLALSFKNSRTLPLIAYVNLKNNLFNSEAHEIFKEIKKVKVDY